MKNIEFKVEGMHCNGCALGLEAALEELGFVKSAEVSYPASTAKLEVEENYDMSAIEKAVINTGFSVAK